MYSENIYVQQLLPGIFNSTVCKVNLTASDYFVVLAHRSFLTPKMITGE